MKKFFMSVIMLFLLFACANLTVNEKKYIKFNNISATIVTSKGDIELFLYPGSAPITTANFIFLAKNHFYDNLVFHRVDDLVVQTGDPNGNGTGGAGYVIPDEFDAFLKYSFPGIVGMANLGPNSSSSQFFITKEALPSLNGSYTPFATLKSSDDLILVKSLEVGDVIEKIEIKGDNVDAYLDNFSDYIKEWKEKIEENAKKIIESNKKLEEKK